MAAVLEEAESAAAQRNMKFRTPLAAAGFVTQASEAASMRVRHAGTDTAHRLGAASLERKAGAAALLAQAPVPMEAMVREVAVGVAMHRERTAPARKEHTQPVTAVVRVTRAEARSTATSRFPSPLKSAIVTLVGYVATASGVAAVKSPFPSPKRTPTALSLLAATTRSRFPSPSKSLVASPKGPRRRAVQRRP